MRSLTDQTRQIALMLANARENGAAEALGYGSWEAFVKAEFGISRQHGYRLVDFAQVAAELEAAIGLDQVSPVGDITEREARDLKPGLAKTVRAVKRAVTSLPTDASPEKRAEALRDTLDRRAADPRVTAPPKASPAPKVAPAAAPPAEVPLSDPPSATPPTQSATSAPAEMPRWRDLLGVELATRVAAVAPADPAAFCVTAVREAVRLSEERKVTAAKVRKRNPCKHPDNRRTVNGRCKDCGDTIGVVFRAATG